MEAAAGRSELTFADALARDRGAVHRRFQAWFDDPVLRDAITVASPSAEAALSRWRVEADPGSAVKVERVLARYITRASARSTPFGLFAGVSVGLMGDRTKLVLPPRRDYRRLTRISLAWATELAEMLASNPEARVDLTYRTNPTVYRLHRRWRYVGRRREGGAFVHSLREVRESAALRTILDRARHGARLEELADALLTGARRPEEADAFLGRLIRQQLLLPELEPPVPGGEPADELVARLEAVPAAASTLRAVRAAREELAKINRKGVGVDPEEQRRAAHGLLGEAPSAVSAPLDTQLHKPAPGLSLGPRVVAELERGIALLSSWAPDGPPDPLGEFREAFRSRYGDREVPLAEVLDEDAGIGLPAPARDGGVSRRQRERDRLLSGKVQQALREGSREITVEEGELGGEVAELPHSLLSAACLEARSAAAVDAGHFTLWLKFVRGPGAAVLMARFGGPEHSINGALAELIAAEEKLEPDAIHAEVASLPQLEYASTLYRPRLREWEIEYPLLGGGAPARRLRVEDLLVSVVNGMVEIRRRDGRRVAPKLTSALNLELALPPAYRFLALVERQRGIELAWRWGALDHGPFLPRVRSGRVVLAPARWKLGREEIESLTSGAYRQRFSALQDIRERLDVPRLVALADIDNLLPVDLETTTGVEILLSLLRHRDEASLVEMFPDPELLCAEGPEGRFSHELLVPFLARQPVRRPPRPAGASTPSAEAGGRRSFPPGSRWLYAKFYAGRVAGDALVRDRLGPLCARLVEEGAAERWFFVRYEDPHPHIRLRLEGEPSGLRERALPLLGELAEGLMERRMSWRLVLDTYEPEVERYGGPEAIDHAHRWFCADSEAAAEALAALRARGAGPEERWRAGLAAADMALAQFAPDECWRLAAVRAAKVQLDQALADVRPDVERPTFAARYSAGYREARPALEAALEAARSAHPDAPAGCAAFSERADLFDEVAGRLRELSERGALVRSLRGVCLSLVHMRLNRLLVLTSREPELRLYDTLERLYSSELARAAGSERR